MGFDHFQGYFLCRPQTIKCKRLSENRLVALKLLQELNNPEADINVLDDVIRSDVALSYKLLRYINSAAFGLPLEIESIRYAVVYLGIDEVRKWASLIVLSNINDKPSELINTSLVRAKMCELLTSFTGQGNPGTAFIVGLFSTLDAMMDAPLAEVLGKLPVVKDVKAALLETQGTYGHYLNVILAYEKADWATIDSERLTQAAVSDIYCQSIRWADGATKSLGNR
jgi:EAL and modified HD-GYP domain-containing signal transduction protein